MIDTNDDEDRDMLAQMMAAQREFNARFSPYTLPRPGAPVADGDALTAELQKQIIPMIMEAAEALDWTPWKHWSKRVGNKAIPEGETYTPAHQLEIATELADNLKFNLNAFEALGYGPRDVFELFFRKGEVNVARQETGTY